MEGVDSCVTPLKVVEFHINLNFNIIRIAPPPSAVDEKSLIPSL